MNRTTPIQAATKPKWAVVVPTNRPEKFQEWHEAWQPILSRHDAKLIVVQDIPEGIFSNLWFDHDSIPELHPRGTDMIRSHGIHVAHKIGATYTATFDDDTLPIGDPLAEYERVFEEGAELSPYLSVGALTTYGGPLRGFPYGDRRKARVAIQYGGWDGVLDYDAATQLNGVSDIEGFYNAVVPVPVGVPVTTCAMNCACRTEVAPIMWQLPLVDGLYNRFGDIWSGLFQKATLDCVGEVMVVNGRAKVRHERASDPVTNLEREAPGVKINETLWQSVRGAYGEGMLDAYRDATGRGAKAFPPDYARQFLAARDEWLALF